MRSGTGSRLLLPSAVAILLGVLWVGFGLRVSNIDRQSIWYDEGLSIYYARQSLPALLRAVSESDHPPLHPLLLHLWIGVCGDSEFSVRMLSAWWGVLSIALLYRWGRRLSVHVGVLSALLLSVSPFAIWFSQETRGYTLALALVIGAAVVSLDLLPRVYAGSHLRARPAAWYAYLVYVLLAAAALYTHFYSGFVLLAFNVAFLIAQVRPLSGCRQSTGQVIGWLCAQIAVLVLFAPWMPVVASQLEGNATYWHGAVDWVQIVGQTLRAFSVGETLDDAWVAGATGVMSLSVLLGAVALSRHQRGRWSALLLWLWMLIPTAILVLLNRSRPKFSPRYLMNALPAFLLLVSVGALWLFRTVRGSAFTFRGWVALAALLVTVAILGGATARSLANLYFDAETYRPDFRAVAEYIEAHASGDDVIVLLGGHSYPAFTYYYRGPLPVLPVPKRLLPTTREPIDIRAFAALNDASAGKSRLWLVLWQASLADPTGLVVDALEQTYRRLGVGQTFHEVALLCFDVSPGPLLPEGAVPQSPLVAELGGQVRFLGYDLPVRSAPPGGTLYLYLYWEALTRMEHDYKVFTQILDETGRIVAQQDRVAGAASYPTSHWEPGAIVRDRFLLTVQRDAAPGTYRLIVGMYDPSPAMPRLSVRGEGGEGDRIFLADIRVTDE